MSVVLRSQAGLPTGPLLFIVYIQQLIEEALRNTMDGVKVNGLVLCALQMTKFFRLLIFMSFS